MRRLALVSLLCVALLLAGCSNTLAKLSAALSDASKAVGTLQTTVIEANKAGAMSDASTETILRLCFKVNAGGQDASKAMRNLTTLQATDRQSLLAAIRPLLAAVQDAVATGTLAIADGPTRLRVATLLTALQTSLVTAETVLVN